MPVIWEEGEDWTPCQRAVIELLDDWFEALEDGSAGQRLPRPDYPKSWTDAQLDQLVAMVIDDYVERQRSWATQKHGIAYRAHCGFDRLAPPQRLALAQDLQDVMDAHGQVTGEPAPPPAYSGECSYG